MQRAVCELKKLKKVEMSVKVKAVNVTEVSVEF